MALDIFLGIVGAKLFEWLLVALVKTLKQYQIKHKDEQHTAG